MKWIQHIGLALFLLAMLIFTAMLGLNKYQITGDELAADNDYHKEAIIDAANAQGLFDQTFASSLTMEKALKKSIKAAQKSLSQKAADGLPEGVAEWDYKIGEWKIKEYIAPNITKSAIGPVRDHPLLFFFLTFGLGILGGLLFIFPKFVAVEDIKHNRIYHNAMTRGLTLGYRGFFLLATILGVLLYGIKYMGYNLIWPIITAFVVLIISALVLYYEKEVKNNPPKSASPNITAWVGIATGIYFIIFYVLLYWTPQHISAWTMMVDPLSRKLSGNPASQWFLYGLMYSVIVIVMGIRMMSKYMHNRYQLLRTGSVMFFQTAIAFLIPEILVRLNQPFYDFKNIWPLNYTFFFDYNIDNLVQSGGLGIFMLVWGILLIVVAVPVITYFFGKRWYCSWVCGCGGLAETLGDPYRQLSNKSLKAWRFERWIIHGVLVFAVVMTFLVLYTYFTGQRNILFFNSDNVRTWYGFLIGSAFAGVVGTGFYPLMGNRMWCRFGCPLAAYLGLVQKFKSRFRITTNGGQCISCGNCSTYCEMGIDVRWYAQRGQDIVRSSCVGCGVCSAVCPRGVLRLENNGSDISERTTQLRTIHISESEVGLLG